MLHMTSIEGEHAYNYTLITVDIATRFIWFSNEISDWSKLTINTVEFPQIHLQINPYYRTTHA
jgi:hypothetical protein